jgi:hypothetical protein
LFLCVKGKKVDGEVAAAEGREARVSRRRAGRL